MIHKRKRNESAVPGTVVQYSKELSLRNQPLETQRWIWLEFLGNWLAGSETLSFQTLRAAGQETFLV